MTNNQSPSRFVAGLDLSEQFFHQAVAPILAKSFPQLRYSAALVGNGSEVLGFDNLMSTDHHWGPRAMLFLSKTDAGLHRAEIDETLALNLPYEFAGFTTNFSGANGDGVRLLQPKDSGPINHRVEIHTIEAYLNEQLGFDADEEPDIADWLSFPEQKLRSLTAGRVFRDDVGLLGMRAKLAYYPEDVWFYILAADWKRLEQETHLMLRAGTAGDELGSQVIAGRLCRDLMHLCFHLEKQYAPYPKWFGTAFSKLACGPTLEPILKSVLTASNWHQRQEHWSKASELVAEMHNGLRITDPLPTKVSPFFDRPFNVISVGAFSQAISDRIRDPRVMQLLQRPLIGNLDIVSDNTDIACQTIFRPALRQLYGDATAHGAPTERILG